ncbi:MAG: hypothetical protein WCT52_00900 [Candidatus Micrarchaeia archaeon]
MAVEIVPAILVKSRAEFEKKIAQVAPYVSRVQIDIMDGRFVPNETLRVEEFTPIPENLLVEYHLMVENPLDYVRKIGKKGAIYELHIESFTKAGGRGGKSRNPDAEKEILAAIEEVRRLGGIPALVLSPDTPAEEAEPYLKMVEQVLVMTVYPGFSGQKYISAMEGKMSWLAQHGAIVEVDGGVDMGSAKTAARAGATLLGVASGIFAKPDLEKAIAELKKDAEN